MPYWHILAESAPALREYDGEVVVHHALSNDTYRLSASAGALLKSVIAAEPRAGSVASSAIAEDPQAEAMLEALAELGFVTRC
jgi:hypothetical protein